MIVYRRAGTKADLDEVHRLRIRVLCQERKRESGEHHPVESERDLFDQYAVHVIARHFDLIPVGTLRMVWSNPLGLPAEKICGLSISGKENAAELSKLAISKLGIRISGARQQDVLVGLLRVLCRESRALGIQYWYAMLSRSMHRLMGCYGIHPMPVRMAGEPRRNSLYVTEVSRVEKLLFVDSALPDKWGRCSRRPFSVMT